MPVDLAAGRERHLLQHGYGGWQHIERQALRQVGLQLIQVRFLVPLQEGDIGSQRLASIGAP